MMRTLLLSILCAATVTACANTQTSVLQTRADSRQRGLELTSISAGACDDAGQFIMGKPDMASFQEASAMPLH